VSQSNSLCIVTEIISKEHRSSSDNAANGREPDGEEDGDEEDAIVDVVDPPLPRDVREMLEQSFNKNVHKLRDTAHAIFVSLWCK